MSKQIHIKYVKWGIANRFGDVIELNHHLKKPKYKLLRNWIIKHEISHDEGPVTFNDIRLDVVDTFFRPKIIIKEMFWFNIKHPTTWVQSSPIWIRNGQILFDWSNILSYVVYAIIVWGIYVWVT